jgi:hypothetical protein
MRTKLIVTNCSRLRKKYADFPKVKAAINALIAADKARGIDARLVDVSDAATMQKIGAKAVTQPKSPKQNKIAIDAIWNSVTPPPDYLMILGAVDVIPHQDLANPMFGGDDEDEHAWGDLPYACDAPYSTAIEDFVAPSRVIGRLPDLDGAKDSSHLRSLLRNAANWVPMKATDYNSYFALSAKTWIKSTRLSVKKTFGSQAGVFVSPADGPQWTSDQLAPLSHFINCHGDDGRSQFYGENPAGKPRFPVAHETIRVRNNIAAGTVAAVECCYGAQLYKPSASIDPEHGICQEYLAGNAYGFFGSTTIAYGPAEGNGSADIICAAFLQHVLSGSSIGLAALQARQDFIKACKVMDPADLKTLGQFNLLGDPSIHPVQSAKTKLAKPSKNMLAAARPAIALDGAHGERRETLRENAPKIAARTSTCGRRVADEAMDERARNAVAALGLRPTSVKTFAATTPAASAKSLGLAAKISAKTGPKQRLCVVTARHRDDEEEPHRGFVVAMMREEHDGSMTMVRKLFSK